MQLREVSERASRKHPLMTGVAWTFGPSEKSKYLAAGQCKGCGEQVTGEYVKSKEKSDDQVIQVALHRGEAVRVLVERFANHTCVVSHDPTPEA